MNVERGLLERSKGTNRSEGGEKIMGKYDQKQYLHLCVHETYCV